jgi:predicted methyltransferase
MRLIDADALIDFIDCGHLRNPFESCFSERDVVDMLESRPTIDAVPVVRGEWIAEQKGAEYCEFRCSACDGSVGQTDQFDETEVKQFSEWYKYCPNCGARMDGAE